MNAMIFGWLLVVAIAAAACTVETEDEPDPEPPVKGTWKDPDIDTCAELNALCRERWGTDPTKPVGAVWCFQAEGTEQVFDDVAGRCLVPSERVRFQ